MDSDVQTMPSPVLREKATSSGSQPRRQAVLARGSWSGFGAASRVGAKPAPCGPRSQRRASPVARAPPSTQEANTDVRETDVVQEVGERRIVRKALEGAG